MGLGSSPSSVPLSQSSCGLRLPPQATRRVRTVIEMPRHPKSAEHRAWRPVGAQWTGHNGKIASGPSLPGAGAAGRWPGPEGARARAVGLREAL